MIPTADLPLPGTGTVLRPFPFRFDFPLQEGFDFLTDVCAADDGSEQRIAVRDPARPRAIVKGHVVALERDEVMHLIALTFGWNNYTYGVPLWFHAMTMADDAEAGDLTLTVVDETGRDLEARLLAEDDVPVLIWSAHDNWEPAILSATAAGLLTLRNPIANDWPMLGTLVLPLQLMLLADLVETQRPARGIAELELEFIEGHVPVSPNPVELCGNPGEPTEESTAALAEMVRPMGVEVIDALMPAVALHDQANSGGLHPNYADGTPPTHPEWTLYGYTFCSSCGVLAHHTAVMVAASKGRRTGFSRCTTDAPAAFEDQILAIGLGTVVGVDCSLSCFGAYPAGLAAAGPFIVGSSFSGLGYFQPAGGAPSVHQWRAVVATLRGGVSAVEGAAGEGSLIMSYGLYEAGYPGGIHPYPLSAEVGFALTTVSFEHGYCVKLSGIGAWKGYTIVTERCHLVGGVEDGTFEPPAVVTHNFADGAYSDAAGSWDGAFAVVLAGGADLLGNVHDGSGFVGEAFRVTVSLIDMAGGLHLQWQDIFTAMLVRAVIVP